MQLLHQATKLQALSLEHSPSPMSHDKSEAAEGIHPVQRDSLDWLSPLPLTLVAARAGVRNLLARLCNLHAHAEGSEAVSTLRSW